MGIFIAMGVILSKSTLGIIVLFISFMLIFLFLQKKSKLHWAGMLIVLILFCGFLFNNPKLLKISSGFDNRLSIWQQTMNKIKINPLFGLGLGIYKTFKFNPGKTKAISLEAHNDWLERTVEFGVVGLFLMTLVVINSLRNFNYRQEGKMPKAYLISFVSFLLLMSGSFVMEIAPTALLGMVDFWAVEKT